MWSSASPAVAVSLLEPQAPGSSEEERLLVESALRALPPEQREVVHLKMFEGLTFQEIGERCGVSLNTAGSCIAGAEQAMCSTASAAMGAMTAGISGRSTKRLCREALDVTSGWRSWRPAEAAPDEVRLRAEPTLQKPG